MVMFQGISQEEKYIFDLVTFQDVLINYNKNYKLFINFTLDPKLKGSTRDWIAIFPAGWDKFESFLAFEWGLGRPLDESGRKRRIIIGANSLKNAQLNTNYQFVYISKYLEILGVSRFFQFVDVDVDVKQEISNFNSKIMSCDGNICNSTEYQNVSSSTQPTCSLNLPNNWEQIFTTCWRCKNFFEMKNQLNAKIKLCTDENEQLKERLNRLENVLENTWMPKTLLDPWDEQKERIKYERFIYDINHTINRSLSPIVGDNNDNVDDIDEIYQNNDLYQDVGDLYEIGDHLHHQLHQHPSNNYDYHSNDASSRELLLKTIIRRQEMEIRELRKTIDQLKENDEIKPNKSITNTDIVTLVKIEESSLPEIVELTPASDDIDENHNEVIQENLLEIDSAAGDQLKNKIGDELVTDKCGD